MDTEGIYRKSGGLNQVKMIQQGFEKDPQMNEISDPDLDIHAITSAVKQYFRKLPNPLITFDCYDGMLDAVADGAYSNDDHERATAMRRCLNRLPKCHRDTLEFLCMHLARVVEYEKQNLVSFCPFRHCFSLDR